MQVQPSPNTERRVRFALVGCGRIAANHFESFERHAERAELVAVRDNDAAALAAATQRTGARGLADLHRMLDALGADQAADALVVCTPSGLHPQQPIAAARAGLHVVTEKPMATRWADGLAMVKACEDRKSTRL